MRNDTGDRERKNPGTLLSAGVLVLILLLSFSVRGVSWFLPAFSPEERPYLRDEAGDLYLPEMDSYFYLRKSAEMAEKGEITFYNSRTADPLIGQRVTERRGDDRTPLGLSVLAFVLWRYLFSHFGLSLTQTAIWMGPFFGSLAAIPAFLYVRRRTGPAGGITAGLLTGCAVPFAAHTCAGFFDTDMMLALLPLVYLLCQMRCMQEESLLKQLGYGVLSAAAIAVMYWFWVAFNAYCLLLLICTAFTILLVLAVPFGSVSEEPRRRKLRMIRGGLLGLVLTPVFLFLTGGSHAIQALLSVLGLLSSASGASGGGMPNAYRFTGEMRALRRLPGLSPLQLVQANTDSVLGLLGGAIPCVLAAAGLLAAPVLLILGLRRGNGAEDDRDSRDVPALCTEIGFLTPWLLLSLKLAFTSVRYCEIAVLPVCILCGLAVGRIASAGRQTERRFRKPVRAAGLVLAALAVLPACFGAWQAAWSANSPVTDSKNQAMTFIREQLPADTAVAGWWDDGYYTEYCAGRRTLADGGSSSGRLNWLLGRALLTEDAGLSANICRMLNESGTDALDAMTAQGMDEADAAVLLLRLLSLDRAGAERLLRASGMDPDLLNQTHPERHGGLVLTLSTDLLGKYKALEYYAFWNPKTGRTEQNDLMLLSGASAAPDENGRAELAMQNSDVVLHISEEASGRVSVTVSNSRGETYRAGRVCVWQDGVKRRDDRSDPDSGEIGIVLVKEDGRYCALLCHRDLCDSLLFRLLFCEDRRAEDLRLLGTWYGDTERESCAAQRRIGTGDRTQWTAQVWRLE